MRNVSNFRKTYSIYDRVTGQPVNQTTLFTTRESARLRAAELNNGSRSRTRRYVPVTLNPQWA